MPSDRRAEAARGNLGVPLNGLDYGIPRAQASAAESLAHRSQSWPALRMEAVDLPDCPNAKSESPSFREKLVSSPN